MEKIQKIKSFITGPIPIVSLFILLMVSLYLMVISTQGSEQFDEFHVSLIILNSIFLIMLMLLIGANLVRLGRKFLHKDPGSSLTMRIMIMFMSLSLIPVLIIFIFSLWLVERGVDSWFDLRVENALTNALELSRSSLDSDMRRLRQQIEPVAFQLSNTTDDLAYVVLSDLVNLVGAEEAMLLGFDNQVIASGAGDITSEPFGLPTEEQLRLLNETEKPYIGLEEIENAGIYIRLLFKIPESEEGSRLRILNVISPVSEHVSSLSQSVKYAFESYEELLRLQKPLKQSLLLTLSLVLFFGILFAIWSAFFSSHRLMSPIRRLVKGTEAVAAGEYSQKLPVEQKDDLGMLVNSFNNMLEKLAAARYEADTHQQTIDNQRVYLQTILQHLSSGVISLDKNYVLKTTNTAASQILDTGIENFLNKPFNTLKVKNPHLNQFCAALQPLLEDSKIEWEKQIEIPSRNAIKTLKCQGARLPKNDVLGAGHVIVFDDITAVIEAQRDAAWGEVARRLAHEIKNPLTPIQLSAERLRNKLLPDIDAKKGELLDRATHTIVQQVESMKNMVNDFTEYARPAKTKHIKINVNTLVQEIMDLYHMESDSVDVNINLNKNLTDVEGDPDRIRQLIHNLVKNSLEALQDRKNGIINIETYIKKIDNKNFTILSISDNGPGFDSSIIDRAFEPYTTTKSNGNGLGLSIVKKIVDEHAGKINIKNKKSGAQVEVYLTNLNDNNKH